jgi:DNA-directed RNA polymerase subunit A'
MSSISTEVENISTILFSLYSLEKLKRISTVDLNVEKDVFSPKLGTGSDVYCSLCADPKVCPGHLGYIELCFPIIHPLYGSQLVKILNSFCHSCYRLLGSDLHFCLRDIFEIFPKLQFCDFCKSFSVKYSLNANKNVVCLKNDSSVVLDVRLIRDMFSRMNNKDLINLGFKNGSHPKNFILEAIPVTPNCVRMRGDFMSKIYGKIIQINKRAFQKEDDVVRHKYSLSIYREYTSLLGVEKSHSESVDKSLKSKVSGKSGLFRNSALGKRVNYCGRSVISPDPNLGVDVVGIPRSFVKDMPFKQKDKDKRYIQDGDFILINRQPSLKSTSIMAFAVKIVECSTIVLNPAVCPAFNADFDGDEMNVFFPTNHMSRVEAIELLNVKECVVPFQDDKPAIYPIQDSVSGLYMLTSDTTFVSLETFCDCLVSCWEKNPVNIVDKLGNFNKNVQMIAGKSLFSYILPDISYKADGIEIESGVLIKGQINAIFLKAVIKEIVEKIGGYEAVRFIDNVQTLVVRWMMDKGFSIGYDDCYVEGVTDSESIERSVVKYVELSKSNDNEMYINVQLNNIRNVSQKVSLEVVEKKQERNGILEIVKSGAKGSMTNFAQIISLVGQQNVGGKRPEKRLSKNTRTLPHFVPGDNSPEALGFCFSSYSKGLSPTEYFLHCQGAREGLINTGVNTAKTGYIQRKFTKSLEDVKVCYDGTTRCGSKIIQFF